MKIEQLTVRNGGFVACKSDFYTASDILDSRKEYSFAPGINRLCGEIDSGIWAVSYLLSMYAHRPKDFILHEPPTAAVNGEILPLESLADSVCYLVNRMDPLFARNRPLDRMISAAIRRSGADLTPEEVRTLFQMDAERFIRPISGVGHEAFKAMAALAYCRGRQIFCFPWMSKSRFDAFHGHLSGLLPILEGLGVTVILPVGL